MYAQISLSGRAALSHVYDGRRCQNIVACLVELIYIGRLRKTLAYMNKNTNDEGEASMLKMSVPFCEKGYILNCKKNLPFRRPFSEGTWCAGRYTLIVFFKNVGDAINCIQSPRFSRCTR